MVLVQCGLDPGDALVWPAERRSQKGVQAGSCDRLARSWSTSNAGSHLQRFHVPTRRGSLLCCKRCNSCIATTLRDIKARCQQHAHPPSTVINKASMQVELIQRGRRAPKERLRVARAFGGRRWRLAQVPVRHQPRNQHSLTSPRACACFDHACPATSSPAAVTAFATCHLATKTPQHLPVHKGTRRALQGAACRQ